MYNEEIFKDILNKFLREKKTEAFGTNRRYARTQAHMTVKLKGGSDRAI